MLFGLSAHEVRERKKPKGQMAKGGALGERLILIISAAILQAQEEGKRELEYKVEGPHDDVVAFAITVVVMHFLSFMFSCTVVDDGYTIEINWKK